MCIGQFLTESIKEQKKERQKGGKNLMIEYGERNIKEIRQFLEEKDKIIKILAEKLNEEIEGCPTGCNVIVNHEACWIAWAKEQAKNGT